MDEEKKFWTERYVNFMEEWGDIYINTPYFQQEMKAIQEFVEQENLSEKVRILDLGCGSLPASEFLIKKPIELWVADLDLKLAEKKWKDLGKPDINFKKIDLRKKLPFNNQLFDGVIAAKTLTFVPAPQGKEPEESLKNIFQEIHRILKPGGWLIWSSTVKGVSTAKGVTKGLGFIMNPLQWIKLRCFLPLFAYRLNEIFKPVMKKAEKGTYPVFGKEKYEEIVRSASFQNPQWKDTGGFQVLVNKVKKPLS